MKAPVCRVKVAEFDPEAIATDRGAASQLFWADSNTAIPLVGTVPVTDTVQLLEVEGPIMGGIQTNVEMRIGATRLTVALLELLL